MKVSGFTIIRNAATYDYPVVESIRSLLPLCDEIVVMLGNSEDETESLIRSIDPGIRIIPSGWDDSLREGGKVLAVETNKAFDAVAADSDWAFYLQADEVLHEADYDTIRDSMKRYAHDPAVEGLLFNYVHFYGTYDYVGDSRRWYRHEIRIIRNDKRIRSFRDAQGFRIDNRKLRVKKIDARVFHYGWVKHPAKQKAKEKTFNRLWHDDDWMKEHVTEEPEFDYSGIDSLKRFEGTHPVVMHDRIEKMNWHFEYNPEKRKIPFKHKILMWIERVTGKRLFEYKNYRSV